MATKEPPPDKPGEAPPDQQEDPEAYVEHVDKIREQDAQLAEAQAEIDRQRGFGPPPVDEAAEAALAKEVADREAKEAAAA